MHSCATFIAHIPKRDITSHFIHFFSAHLEHSAAEGTQATENSGTIDHGRGYGGVLTQLAAQFFY